MSYSEILLDHALNPRNIGEFTSNENYLEGRVGSEASGNIIQMRIKINDNKIEDVRIKIYGNPATIAAASWIGEEIKGKTVSEALAINSQNIAKALELPAVKMHCALLAEDVVKASLMA